MNSHSEPSSPSETQLRSAEEIERLKSEWVLHVEKEFVSDSNYVRAVAATVAEDTFTHVCKLLSQFKKGDQTEQESQEEPIKKKGIYQLAAEMQAKDRVSITAKELQDFIQKRKAKDQ